MSIVLRSLAGISLLILLVGGFGSGCGDQERSDGWSKDIRDAHDPLQQTPLAEMPEVEIRKTLRATRVEIQQSRPIGMHMLITALKNELVRRGMDPTPLDRIDDSVVTPAATPMPGGTVATKPIASRTSSLVSSQSYALADQDHYACPILAEETNTGTDCAAIVDAIVVQVKKDVDQAQMEQNTQKTHTDLSDTSVRFISAWMFTATNYGIDVAAIYAKYELMAAQQCDDKSNANKISFNLGTEQGWQIVESLREWAITQVDTCLVNTDVIAEQVRVMSRQRVDEFMTENKVCESADISDVNAALKEAEARRREGILTGIDERVEILRNELFQQRDIVPCGGGDGGDGGDGGGGGEPLAIDLDGDGLTLQAERVRFDILGDGSTPEVTWFGPREGIVAIDLDGDGAITSVKELMGDQSDCGGRLCYDGIAALSAYDSPERGGNGDGRIDSEDEVYSRLLIWVDSNSDGVSQPEELSRLADHGIRAIDLKPQEYIQRSEGGVVSGKIQVLTDNGFRYAYDAWLRVRLEPEKILERSLPR